MKNNIIKIPVESNWLPPYRLEYDGKYLTLFGRDKNFEVPYYGLKSEKEEDREYEEMVLVPVVIERRGLKPNFLLYTKNMIVIDLYSTELIVVADFEFAQEWAEAFEALRKDMFDNLGIGLERIGGPQIPKPGGAVPPSAAANGQHSDPD
jgi:hypothetical protein